MYELHEYELGKARRVVVGSALLSDDLFDDPSGNHTMLTLAIPMIGEWLNTVGPVVLAAPAAHEYAWVRRLMLLADVGGFRCVHVPVDTDGIVEVLLAPGAVPASWGQPARVGVPFSIERVARDAGVDAAEFGLTWLQIVGLIAE